MSKVFYPKLALTNIKKNGKTYIPYMLTCIFSLMMYYMMHALSQNGGLDEMAGGGSLKVMLNLGSIIVAIFSAIFLFYTNSFLIKRRKKELGLYNVLGLGKRHIARVLFYECLFTSVISMVLGLLAGIIFNKAMFLFLLKLLQFEVPLGFSVSMKSLIYGVIIFATIFMLTLMTNLMQIKLANPIQLLKGGQVGEKEPKTKIIMTVFGIVCIGIGYGLALSTPDPIKAIPIFFVAVLFVMAGTYSLFTSGSIAVLKLLKRNRSFYYKTKNFISVSSMMYRMKRNAVGLANICILSTAVIITLSGTVSLYAGMNDVMETRYPREINITKDHVELEEISKLDDKITEALADVEIENAYNYSYIYLFGIINGTTFQTSEDNNNFANLNRILQMISIEDYNRLEGSNVELAEDEVLLYSLNKPYGYESIEIDGRTYKVKELDSLSFAQRSGGLWLESYYIFLNNTEDINSIHGRSYVNAFDLKSKDYTQGRITSIVSNELRSAGYDEVEVKVETREGNTQDFLSIYGGLFFVGLFIGVVFLMATVLIIYYKQISEGYDDKVRFQIMQKVGIDKGQIRKTIKRQVLIVFFLPLVFAIIHITAAFPIVTKLLSMLNLYNVNLFLMMTIGTVIVFTIIYALIFWITARTYYKIVEE